LSSHDSHFHSDKTNKIKRTLKRITSHTFEIFRRGERGWGDEDENQERMNQFEVIGGLCGSGGGGMDNNRKITQFDEIQ